MTIKEIIKLFIPPIFFKLKYTPEKKIYYSTIKNFSPKTKNVFILGNGPTLTISIKKYYQELQLKDCIVVNSFAETEYYTQIKPNIYVIADPAFFQKTSDLSDYLQVKINKTISSIIEKTSWEITLIVPSSTMDSETLKKIKENKKIMVLFYNNLNIEEWKNQTEKFLLYDKNLIAPPAQTVINTCVFLGIFWNFHEIYLLGADTSWHEDMVLDQKTNILYMNDKHFYGNELVQIFSDANGKVPCKLHENFFAIGAALENYMELEFYAKYKKVKVYNASEKSWIDAFERY